MAGLNINTKFLSHFNGQNGGKEIIDNGNTGHIITQVATASLDTSVKQFGSTSLFLDGNSDYLTIPDSPDFDIFATTTEDWAIDFWIRRNEISSEKWFITQFEDINNRWSFFVDSNNSIRFTLRTSGANTIDFQTPSSIMSINTWHHIVLMKVADEYGIYVDGIQKAYIQDSSTDTYAGTLFIGQQGDGTLFLDGNMDELRIQNSNAFLASPNVGLTDTITVPVNEHISDVNTKLLLHLNSHDVSGDGGSNNYHIPTFQVTAQLDTTLKNFGTASLLLDGNSDSISLPDSSDWDIFATTTENWTVDCWVYPTGSGDQQIIGQLEDINNEWGFRISSSGTGIFLRVEIATVVRVSISVSISDISNSWHHLCFVKIADEYGVYLDGIQIGYDTDTNTKTFASDLVIGRKRSFADFYQGNIDELRIQNSNPFLASPNVGSTDTITVPITEYSLGILPNAPTSLVATTIDDNQIDLSWVAPIDTGSEPITGYKIERESPISGGFSTLVVDTGNTNITFSDIGLDPATQYNYRVSAITSAGTGDPSNEDNATTDSVVPDAPTDLVAGESDCKEITLDWVAPVFDGGSVITGYKIERESPISGGFSILVVDTGNTNVIFVDSGLLDTTQYNYRVSAINIIGTSVASNESDATTPTVLTTTDKVELLIHSNGAQGQQTDVDSSGKGHTISIDSNSALDRVTKLFGSASLDTEAFGPGGGMETLELTDEFQLFKDTINNQTYLTRVKLDALASSPEIIFSGTSDQNNHWRLFFPGTGNKYRFILTIASVIIVDISSAVITLDTNWHDITICKKGSDIGFYYDGVQILYHSIAATNTIGGKLEIGRRDGGSSRLLGNIDETIVTAENLLNASPNVGLTDTITVPTTSYCIETIVSPSDDEFRFNPNEKVHEKIDPIKDWIFNLLTGRHYKNLKK